MAKKKVSLTQFAVAVAGRHPVKPILAADIMAFIVRIGGYLAIGMHIVLLAAPKSAALLQVREAVSAVAATADLLDTLLCRELP